MLPNLKIVIGGIMGFVLLFAVMGAGIVTPLTYTRIGTAPEVSHPMLQHVFADGTAAQEFNASALARRSQELDALRALAASEAITEPLADQEEGEPGATSALKPVTGDSAAADAANEAVEAAMEGTRVVKNPRAASGAREISPDLHAMASGAVAAATPSADTPTPSPASAKDVAFESSGNSEKLAANAPQTRTEHHRAFSRRHSKLAARLHKSHSHKEPQPASQPTAFNPFSETYHPTFQPYYSTFSSAQSTRSSK